MVAYRSMPFRPQLGHWIGSGRGAPGTWNTVWHAGQRIFTGGGGGGSGLPFLPSVAGWTAGGGMGGVAACGVGGIAAGGC